MSRCRLPSSWVLSEGDKRDSKGGMPEFSATQVWIDMDTRKTHAAEATLLRSQRLGLGRYVLVDSFLLSVVASGTD